MKGDRVVPGCSLKDEELDPLPFQPEAVEVGEDDFLATVLKRAVASKVEGCRVA